MSSPSSKSPKKPSTRYTSFSTYFPKILKNSHPLLSLSTASKKELDRFVFAFLKEYIRVIVVMMEHARLRTISSRDVQTATRVLLENKIAKFGVSAGTKSVTKYTSFGGDKKSKSTSTAKKSGLIVSPSVVEKLMRNYKTDVRIGDTAAVYLTGVIEYLLLEILELSGNIAKQEKKKIITPSMIHTAIENDKELLRTFCRLDESFFTS